MHPWSRLWDEKISNLGSGIQDGKNLDPGSWIRDGKHLDPGSRIRDKHPRSAKLEILSPNLLGLKEPNNNRTLCGKGILGWNQVIFAILGRIRGVRERKKACELDFSISNKTQPPLPNYIPRGKTVTAAYLHKALAKIHSGFELKRPSMSVQNLFFARPAPKKPSPDLFSITGCGKRRKNFLPAPFFAYIKPLAFYLLLKVKSELASCLLTQGTFKKSL